MTDLWRTRLSPRHQALLALMTLEHSISAAGVVELLIDQYMTGRGGAERYVAERAEQVGKLNRQAPNED
jgi:hypothetical protein